MNTRAAAVPAKRTPANSIPARDGAEPHRPSPAPIPLADIEEAVRSIRYGVVQIIIQDGVVVQIDKTEKVRLR